MNLNNLFNQSKFDQYAAYLKSTNLSDISIQRKLSSLASFQKFLLKKKLILPTEVSNNTLNLSPQIDQYISNKPKNNSGLPFFKKYIPQPSEKRESSFLFRYLAIFSLFVIGLGIGFTLYRQAFLQSKKNLAYSTISSPVVAGRFLSFQGRLTDSSGNPIVSSTPIVFKLYNTEEIGTGTSLYTSESGNSQTIIPDENGIFSVTIGKSHGTQIPSSVFSENASIWLEITAGGETMSPRQPIATVGYALNSETLQGLPPSASGTKNTVLVIDGSGNLNLGETSPTIKSTSGTLGIEGQAVLIKASDGSGGNIEINPDANGIIKLTTEGSGSTAVGGFINATNANLSTGNLFNGSINNTNRGYNFISFNNYNIGTTALTNRFSVDAYGNTNIGATMNALNISIDNNLVTSSALELNLLDGLLATNGSIIYGNGSALANSSVGTSGYLFASNGAAAPSWIDPSSIGHIYTSSNGITLSNSDFQLGGSLTKNTQIDTSSFNFSFAGSGNIGIGTTSPNHKLDLVGNANISDRLFVNTAIELGIGGSRSISYYGGESNGYFTKMELTTTSGFGTYGPVSGDWALYNRFNGSDTRGWIWQLGSTNIAALNGKGDFQNAGNLTIGGTFVSVGSTNLTTNLNADLLDNYHASSFIYTASNGLNLTSNNFKLGGEILENTRLNIGNTEVLYIQSNGNVSIGNTSPGIYKLSITGTGYYSSTITTGGDVYLQGGDVYDNSSDLKVSAEDNLHFTIDYNNNDSDTRYFTWGKNTNIGTTHSNTNELMRLTETGFLGIGTTNPTQKLDVVGNGYFSTNLNVGGTLILSQGAANGYILSSDASGNTSWINPSGIGQTYNATNGLNLTNDNFGLGGTLTQNTNIGTSSFNLSFTGLNNAQSLFLASSGNVGIGTTNPTSKLDIFGITHLNSILGTTPYISESFTDVSFPPSGFSVGTGTSGFTRDTSTFNSSPASVTANNIGTSMADESYVWMDYGVTLPSGGSLSFNWKVSSEQGYDFLVVCVDQSTCDFDHNNGNISGEVDWSPKTIFLNQGSHTIRWAYIKDGGIGLGQDTGWIDDISITTGSTQGNLYVDSNIGIGTTNSISPLTILSSNYLTPAATFLNSDNSVNLEIRTSASNNYSTFIGKNTGGISNSGFANSGFGNLSLASLTDGNANNAFGFESLYSNTSGSGNNAFGASTLRYNTTGSNNTAFGDGTLYSNISGSGNSAFGVNSLGNNAIGSGNVAIGYNSLSSGTTLSGNIALGYFAGNNLSVGSSNIFIGNYVGDYGSYDNRLYIGSGFNPIIYGDLANNQLSIGTTTTGYTLNVGGTLNAASIFQNGSPITGADPTNGLILIGSKIGLGGTLTQNTQIGTSSFSLSFISSSTAPLLKLLNNDGSSNLEIRTSSSDLGNIFIGTGVGQTNSDGGRNNGVGYQALYANNIGWDNNAFGAYTLFSETTAENNNAFGNFALYSNVNGYSNNAFGYSTLYYNTGGNNSAFGDYSLNNNRSGSYNTAFGSNALRIGTTLSSNIALGYKAGYNLSVGSSNIFIGNDNGASGSYNNRLYIGNGQNPIIFGDLSTGNIGLGTTNPTSKLHLIGSGYFSSNLTIGGTFVSVGSTNLTTNLNADLLDNYHASSFIYTASNGLNLSDNAFGLGGTLTQNTQIGTSSFNLSFLGLGNTQSLYIKSNGNVGIGTTNPTSKLHIFNTTSLSSLALFRNVADLSSIEILTINSNNPIIKAGSDDNLNLSAGNRDTPDLYIDNTSGNVGIGTTNPTAKLHVIGDGYFSSNLSVGGTSSVASNFNVAGFAYFSGNVGISNTNPTFPLTIGTTSVAADLNGNLLAKNFLDIGNTYYGLSPSNMSADKYSLSLSVNGSIRYNYSNDGNHIISGAASKIQNFDNGLLLGVSTSTGGTVVETNNNIFISTANRVGIGTTAPAKKLDVQGDIKLTGTMFVGTGLTGSANQALVSDGAGGLGWANLEETAGQVVAFGSTCPTGWANYTPAAGREIIGIGGTVFTAIGQTGGEVKHTQTVAEMAAHSHTINHDHTAFNTASNGNHTHTYTAGTPGTSFLSNTGGSPSLSSYTVLNGSATTTGTGAHVHSIDVPSYSGNSGTQGSGVAFNILDPYVVMRYCIKEAGSGSGPSSLWFDQGNYLYAANATNVVITDSGSIGIGTTNPTQKIDLIGSMKLTGTIFVGTGVGSTGADNQVLASDGAGGLQWVNATSGTTNGVQTISGNTGLGGTLTQNTQIGTSSFNLSFVGLGNTQSLYLKSNGNVGIGMTNPIDKLQVAGNILPGANLTYNIGSTALRWNAAWIKTVNIGTSTWSLSSPDNSRLSIFNASSNSSGNNVGGTEVFTITANGNIGFGTTAPTQKLEVNGNINISGADNYLQIGIGRIRYNSSTSQFEYSSDSGLNYYSLGIGTGGTIKYGMMESDWVDTGSTLPIAVIDDTVYMFGGSTNVATNVIYSAPASNPTAWTNTGSTLPSVLSDAQVAVIGNYVYLFGGYNGSSYTNIIYRAPTSNPTAWVNTGSTLPSVLSDAQVAVIGNYVYLFGGYNGSYTNIIYRAPVSNPLSWVNTGSTIPAVRSHTQTLTTVGDYVYLFGGWNGTSPTNTIFRAPITNPTSWVDTGSTLPAASHAAQTVVIGDYIYLLGGYNSTWANVIYRAPVSNPTSWVNTGSVLPSAVSYSTSAIIGNNVYLFGGNDVSSNAKKFIYRAPIFSSSPDLSSNASWRYKSSFNLSDINLIDPGGQIVAFASTTCPTGWTEYTPARGKNIIGYNSAQTQFNAIGKTGGEITHTQTIAEMPTHTHIQNAHTHRTDSTSTQNGDWLGLTGGGEGGWGLAAGTNNNIYHLELTSTTATNQNTGSGDAFNVLDPYITLIYCQKNSSAIIPSLWQDQGTFISAVNTSSPVTITDSGFVGIGLSNPGFKLHVMDKGATSTTVGSNILAAFASNASGADATILLSDGVAYSNRISMKSGNLILAPTSGYVGIGNTNPLASLQISNIGANAGIIIDRASGQSSIKAGSGNGGYLMLDSGGTSLGLNWYVADNIIMANGGGSVGIGIQTPGAKLDINGNAIGSGANIRTTGDIMVGTATGAAIFFDGNYSYASGNYIRAPSANVLSFVTGGGERLNLSSSFVSSSRVFNSTQGYLGRAGNGGATSNVMNTHWTGSCVQSWVDTTFINNSACLSDQRLKKNIETITQPEGLEAIIKLNPVTFNWIDTSHQESPNTQYGLIAQEVQKVLPGLVANTGMITEAAPDGLLKVDYNGFIAIAIKAIQDLNAKVVNQNSDFSITSTGQINVDKTIDPEVLASLGYDGSKNEIESATYSITDSLGNAVNRIGQFSELASAKIKAGFVSTTNLIAQNAVVKNLVTDKLNSSEIVSPKGSFDQVTATNIQATSIETNDLKADTATVSTLYADNIISQQGSFGDIMSQKVTALRDELKQLVSSNQSTSSAITGSSILSQSSDWSMDIASDSAKINGDLALTNNLVVGAKLTVNGDTQLGNAFITGTFSAGSIAIKDNMIETTATALYIQPSNTGSIHLMGDTMIIADNGEVQINGNLKVSGSLIANLLTANEIQTNKLTSIDIGTSNLTSDSIKIATDSAQTVIAESGFGTLATSSAQLISNATAGTATLPANKTELIIKNNKITTNSMVYLTPVGSTKNQVPYIKEKVVTATDSYFTIAIDQALDTNIDINWWIIN